MKKLMWTVRHGEDDLPGSQLPDRTRRVDKIMHKIPHRQDACGLRMSEYTPCVKAIDGCNSTSKIHI